MRLRFATAADCEAMRAIYAPYVLHTDISWEYEVPAPQEFAARYAARLAEGFAWLCAQDDDGALLGYAYASRYADRRGYDFSAETTVYVAQNTRGQGVGRALYKALLALLTAQGYCNAYARVTQPNDASDAFHRALGFARQAVLPNMGFKDGVWVGLGIYAMQLCEAYVKHPPQPVPVQSLPQETVAAALQAAR